MYQTSLSVFLTMMKLTKLLHKLSKFIQPKKFKLNNNVKPLTQTSINDKVYILFIPYIGYENKSNKIKEVIITKAIVTFIEQDEQLQIFTFYLQLERNFENNIIASLVGKSIYQNGNLMKIKLIWKIKSKKSKIISINTYQGKIFVSTDKKQIELLVNTFNDNIKNLIKQKHCNNNNGETSQLIEYDHVVNTFKKYSNKLLFKLYTL